jgi:hypothetical protein
MAKTPINNLRKYERSHIRNAVRDAVRYWPNAHLGVYSPREDIHSAFNRLRHECEAFGRDTLAAATAALARDALLYADM